MHEADDDSIWSIWSCYWPDQFLTLAFNTQILSKFSMFQRICLLFILLILMGIDLPLCLVATLSQDAMLYPAFWSQAEYKIVLFYFNKDYDF